MIKRLQRRSLKLMSIRQVEIGPILILCLQLHNVQLLQYQHQIGVLQLMTMLLQLETYTINNSKIAPLTQLGKRHLSIQASSMKRHFQRPLNVKCKYTL